MRHSDVANLFGGIGPYLIAPGLIFLTIVLLLFVIGVLFAPVGALTVGLLSKRRSAQFRRGLAFGGSSSLQMFLPWIYVYFAIVNPRLAVSILPIVRYTILTLWYLGPVLAFTVSGILYFADVLTLVLFDILYFLGISGSHTELRNYYLGLLLISPLYWVIWRDWVRSWRSRGLLWQRELGEETSSAVPSNLTELVWKVVWGTIGVGFLYGSTYVLGDGRGNLTLDKSLKYFASVITGG